MFVLAQNNHTYARLGFNVGPCGQMLIPVEVDYSRAFGSSEHEKWDAEYNANIVVENLEGCCRDSSRTSFGKTLDSYALPYDFIDELENMDLEERRFMLDELAARPDLWDGEEEVISL